MIDQYFTPPKLADLLIDSLPDDFHPSIVADFAVGEGSLLYSGEKKWKNANFIGNDLCLKTLSVLKYNKWELYNIDFSKFEDINNSALKNYIDMIDLVLLNPPFSHRNIKPLEWNNIDSKIRSSLALVFVYNALKFLKPNGYLVAVLPNGCLTSFRDSSAINFLKEHYVFNIITENYDAIFPKVKARTSIVLIKNIKPKKIEEVKNKITPISYSSINIFRGKLQMHKVKENISSDGLPLVHTSNLRNGIIDYKNNLLVLNNESIQGPAILIPRVGNFSEDKICFLSSKEEIIISDCLFAIRCENNSDAFKIKKLILDNWDDFKKNYSGTGALYITLKNLEEFIGRILNTEFG